MKSGLGAAAGGGRGTFSGGEMGLVLDADGSSFRSFNRRFRLSCCPQEGARQSSFGSNNPERGEVNKLGKNTDLHSCHSALATSRKTFSTTLVIFPET